MGINVEQMLKHIGYQNAGYAYIFICDRLRARVYFHCCLFAGWSLTNSGEGGFYRDGLVGVIQNECYNI